MANTSSAKKAARQMIRRTEVNKSRRSQLKAYVRKVEEALASGDKAAATSALGAAEPILMRTAQKGVIHKKSASRKVSRLAARVRRWPETPANQVVLGANRKLGRCCGAKAAYESRPRRWTDRRTESMRVPIRCSTPCRSHEQNFAARAPTANVNFVQTSRMFHLVEVLPK